MTTDIYAVDPRVLRRNGALCTYRALHKRIVKVRGRAKHLECVDCGARAAHWSLEADTAPAHIIVSWHEGRFARHSLDVNDYSPRCNPCHRRLDLEQVQA